MLHTSCFPIRPASWYYPGTTNGYSRLLISIQFRVSVIYYRFTIIITFRHSIQLHSPEVKAPIYQRAALFWRLINQYTVMIRLHPDQGSSNSLRPHFHSQINDPHHDDTFRPKLMILTFKPDEYHTTTTSDQVY